MWFLVSVGLVSVILPWPRRTVSEATEDIGRYRKLFLNHWPSSGLVLADRVYNTWWRKIREAVERRTHKAEMNRDNGYDLPAIY